MKKKSPHIFRLVFDIDWLKLRINISRRVKRNKQAFGFAIIADVVRIVVMTLGYFIKGKVSSDFAKEILKKINDLVSGWLRYNLSALRGNQYIYVSKIITTY